MKVQKGFILGLLSFPALVLAAGDSIEIGIPITVVFKKKYHEMKLLLDMG